MSPLKFSIQGDYVESYIYSGNLLLVDSNYVLSTFRWDELISDVTATLPILERNKIQQIAKDGSKFNSGSFSTLDIEKHQLEKHRVKSVELGVWPTDIGILSNSVYVASEEGVNRLFLNYKSGELGDKNRKSKLYDSVAFSLAPNSHGRLVFAAGEDGIHTSNWLSKDEQRYSRQMLEDKCIEVDWFSTTLVAELDNGVMRYDFQDIPNKNDLYDHEFEAAIRRIKLSNPEANFEEGAVHSWIAGDKVYYITRSGELVVGSVKSNRIPKKAVAALQSLDVLGAKTASFGTVLETSDNLYVKTESNISSIAEDFVSWRVFPRAKNYANHIHVVKNDCLELLVLPTGTVDSLKLDIQTLEFKNQKRKNVEE